jgi:Icc-related predicted phosphoesterase
MANAGITPGVLALSAASCEVLWTMRLLITSDLHLVARWREVVLARLRGWISTYRPDGLVIAGDLSVAPEAPNSLRHLRDIFPNGPIALTLGNHDFWSEAGSECSSLSEIIDRYWAPAADRFAVSLLDLENLTLGEITLTGAYGHYDLGFRWPNLQYDGALVTREHYLAGRPPVASPPRWRDFLRMPHDLDLARVARDQVSSLETRLRTVSGKRALVVLHTPPFAALLGIPDISSIDLGEPSVLAFFRAYLGNAQMGALLRQERERIVGVVCGHTHCEVTPTDLGDFFGLNVGSDYGAPMAYLFETETNLFTKIGPRNDLFVAPGDQ